MRLALLLLLALPAIPQSLSPCEMRAMQKWDDFAADANQRAHVRPASEEERIRAAARLRRKFEEVLNCECF